MNFCQTSTDSFIIYFGDTINEKTAQKVQSVYKALKETNSQKITDLTPSYTSILVVYDFLNYSFEEIKNWIENMAIQGSLQEESKNVVEIPVYYGLEVGLDLQDIASFHNLSVKEVIWLHTNQIYSVYALGFLPGFAYMGEVNEKIATPRVANPRASIPKGSVGIADNQAAIYPKKSPGGWRILGRTPLEMFDLKYDGYSFLKVGDKVKYKEISKDEFLKMGGEI